MLRAPKAGIGIFSGAQSHWAQRGPLAWVLGCQVEVQSMETSTCVPRGRIRWDRMSTEGRNRKNGHVKKPQELIYEGLEDKWQSRTIPKRSQG